MLKLNDLLPEFEKKRAEVTPESPKPMVPESTPPEDTLPTKVSEFSSVVPL